MADNQIVTNIVATSDFSNLIRDVNKVTNSLALLQQQISTTNKQLQSQIAVMNRSFAETIRSTGQFSTHFVSLTSDVEKFGKNLDGGRLKLRDYFRVYQDHIRTSGGLIRDLAKQQVQLQNAIVQPLGRNSQGLMQFNVHIPRGLDEIKNKTALARQELSIMNKVIQDGGVQLINWGKNTQWAGRQLTVGLTLPLAAFGKAAADAFKQADQELTRLTKVYGDIAGTSSKELGKIRKDVAQTAKELSAAMGVNFTETIALAADIAATGKKGNELLSSIKETTRLAVLGEVDRQEAMKATLAIQSAFKQNTDELAESINFLNAVENQTSTTLNDLVEAIPKAGPVIKGLGGNVQDLALYLTAMREGGINASEGANALKSALASLINPTDVAVKKFEGFGIDLLGIVNSNAGNVTKTLFALQSALDQLDPLKKQQAIEQLFGKFQFSRLNALFENLGRQGSQTLQVLDLMKASTLQLGSIADRELAAVTESASGRYKRAVESLKADLAGVGDKFLNIATKIINGLDSVINFLQRLPDPAKNLLTIAGAFTAIAGPVIMLTGVLANFVGYLIKGYGHIKAFLKGGDGFKLLTPQMVAAEKAANLVAASLYSDAKAADVLHTSLTRLKNDFVELQRIAANGGISVQPTISTMAGTVAMTGMPGRGYRPVDPNNPFVGGMASSHLNPRDPRNPATLFGLVPGAEYVNMKIGRTPQILMEERLPNVEGLTSVRASFRGRPYDVSTGVVAGEAARYQALMATLGMQSKAEVAELKKTIEMGGAVSSDFIQTFDDILPLTTRLSTNAARESAAIVAQLRAGKITVEAARAEIMAINARLEAALGAEVSAYAASKGRAIDLTKVPLLDQPVVDPRTGNPNMRALFREGRMQDVMFAVGRATRTRTFGAPYSIETTLPPRYRSGGRVRGYSGGGGVFYNNGDQVPGPNINADVVPAMLTPGEFVIRRSVAQQDPEGMRALNEGRAVVVPVEGKHEGGPIVGHKHPHKFVDAHVTTSAPILASKLSDRVSAESTPAEIREFAQYFPDQPLYVKDNTTIKLPENINNNLREGKSGVTVQEMVDTLETYPAEEIFADWSELNSNQKEYLKKQLINQIKANRNPKDKIYDRDLARAWRISKKGLISGARSAAERSSLQQIFKNRQSPSKIALPSFKKFAPKKSDRIAAGLNLSTSMARKLLAETPSAFPGRPYFFSGPAGSGKVNLILPSGKAVASSATSSIRGLRRNTGGFIPGRAGGIVNKNRMAYGDFFVDPVTGMLLPTSVLESRMSQVSTPSIHGGNFVPLGAVTSGAMGGVPLTGGSPVQENTPMFAQLSGRQRMLGMTASIGGSIGGQMLGSQLTGGSMLGSIAGLMAGEAAATMLMNKYMQLGKAAGQAGTKTSLLMTITKQLAKLPGPLKLLAVITGIGLGIKEIGDRIREHREIINQGFAPTEETADKLNLKYQSIADSLKLATERAEAFKKTGRSLYDSTTQTGIPGLSLTIKELKELQETVKTEFPDLIDIFNKAKPDEVVQKAAQLKAQFVAGGMSAQDATNLIYALIKASNDANMALQAISSEGFAKLKTSVDAAKFSVEVLNQLLADGNTDQLPSALDQAVNSLRNYQASLIGTKNDQNEIVTAVDAVKNTLALINKESKNGLEFNQDQVKALRSQNIEMARILSNTETLASSYAKIQLYTMGITRNLQQMSAEEAQAKLIGVTSILSSVQSTTGPFGKLASRIKLLQNQVSAGTVKAQKAFEKTRDQINEEIKLRQKSITKIKEEADARIKALQEAQEDENILLKIKEKQLEYQDAIAVGDLSGAAMAQLELQGLVKEQQRTLAIRAIESDADKRIKALESEIDALQARLESAQSALTNANDGLANTQKQLQAAEEAMDAVVTAILAKLDDGEISKADTTAINEARKKLEALGYKDLAAKLSLDPTKIPLLAGYDQTVNSLVGNAYDNNRKALRVLIANKDEFAKIFGATAAAEVASTGSYATFTQKQNTKTGQMEYFKDGKKISLDEYNKGKANTPLPPPKGAQAYLHPETALRQRVFGSMDAVVKEYINLNFKGGVYKASNGWTYDTRGFVYDDKRKMVGRWMDATYKSYNRGSTDGPISGPGTGTSDSILARLSNGEYVTKSTSVSDIGVDNMHRINLKGAQGVIEAAKDIIGETKAMGGLLDIPSFNVGGIARGGKYVGEFLGRGLKKLITSIPQLSKYILAKPETGMNLGSDKEIYSYLSKLLPKDFNVKNIPIQRGNMPPGAAAFYSPEGPGGSFFGFPSGKNKAYFALHEGFHAYDAEKGYLSYRTLLDYLNEVNNKAALEGAISNFQIGSKSGGAGGYNLLEDYLTFYDIGTRSKLGRIFDGIQEGVATNESLKVYQSLLAKDPAKARLLGHPSNIGQWYLGSFRKYILESYNNDLAKDFDTNYLAGILAGSPNMPAGIRDNYIQAISWMKLNKYGPESISTPEGLQNVLNSVPKGLINMGLAGGGYIPKFFGGGLNKFLKKFSFMPQVAGSSAAWAGMENLEGYLSRRWGANENASGLSKWGRALGRVAFNTAQGGISGLPFGGYGGLAGVGAGLVEGLIGLAKDGSQYGVKGGAAGFNPNYQEYTAEKVAKDIAASSVYGSLGAGVLKGVGAGIAKTSISKNITNKIGSFIKQTQDAKKFKEVADLKYRSGPGSDKVQTIIEKYGEQFLGMPYEYQVGSGSRAKAAEMVLEDASRSILKGDPDGVNLQATFAKLFYHKYRHLHEGETRDISALWQALLSDEELLAAAEKANYSKEYLSNMYAITGHLAEKTPEEINKWAATQIAGNKELVDSAKAYLESPLMAIPRFFDRSAQKAYEKSNYLGGFKGGKSFEILERAISASDKTPGLQAFFLTYLARTRSTKTDLLDNLLHPTEVPVASGRAYGPGTYFAQTKIQSDQLFKHFGNNIYRPDASAANWIKLLFGKGYITPDVLRQKSLEYGYPDFELGNQDWNHPFIQSLIKEGYIGYKHGDAITNWLIGTGDWKLKPTFIEKKPGMALGGYIMPGFGKGGKFDYKNFWNSTTNSWINTRPNISGSYVKDGGHRVLGVDSKGRHIIDPLTANPNATYYENPDGTLTYLGGISGYGRTFKPAKYVQGRAGGGYINPSFTSNMSMPSFETGVKYLYGDTIAQLHEKEAVLPKNMNPWNPTATNPIGGNSLTYIAPVINAAPGMDIEQLTDVATRKIVEAFSKNQTQSKAKIGEPLSMTRRYA